MAIHRDGVPAVLLTGAPATGKSTVGRLLAGRLGAALLDQDVATGPLVEVIQRISGVTDLDDPRLAGLTRAARYQVLGDLAADNLTAGVPVVLVAPFTAERCDPAAWSSTRDRLAGAGGRPLLAWLALEPALIHERLRLRGAQRDVPRLATGDALLGRLTALAGPPVVPHLRLDATRPAAELAAQVAQVARAMTG